MKKAVILSGIFLLSFTVSGQKESCTDGLIQKLDSLINFSLDNTTGFYTPVDVSIYQFDGFEHYTGIEKLLLPSRNRVNRQNYFFDSEGRKSYYILQTWNGSAYADNARTDYYYNSDGNLEREVFSGFVNSAWEPYQQHWYNYDENKTVTTYLRQMKDASGQWYDFSYKNYIYNEAGQLIERNEQRIADNVIFWAELFTLDNSGKVATRVRQTLKYSPVSAAWQLVNLNKQIYYYDIFGELRMFFVENWTDNSWVLAGKSVYYRSYIKGSKIQMCHNRRTICVPASRVETYLELGDTLGPCDVREKDASNMLNKDGTEKIILYPNPAISDLNIEIPETRTNLTDLMVISQTGITVIHDLILDRKSFTIDISGLLPGAYQVVLYGEGGEMISGTIVKK